MLVNAKALLKLFVLKTWITESLDDENIHAKREKMAIFFSSSTK